MAKSFPPNESYQDLLFPLAGIDVSRAFAQQRSGTTPAGANVRAYEPGSNRARGGQRSGLTRYNTAIPGGSAALIQELFTLVGVGYSPPGGSTQTSTSGRVVTLVAVVGGTVYVASPQSSSWVTPTNNSGTTPALASSGVVLSAANNQKLYFADGSHYRYYDPVLNTVETWSASAGSLPTDSGSNKPRLICTWRGRTVLGGLILDPQNWFMSAVSDPRDWDYAPTPSSPADAVAGNNSPLGLIGDVVTTFIPYSDDVLIVGGDHTIYQFSGDPADGGRIDLISDAIGMAWGAPWCKGPDGTLYFFSNRCGVFAFQPGQGAPQRISQQIEQLLTSINTGTYTIRMVWDDRFQGLHVFVTKTGTQTSATHYFWEQRANAWWQDTFSNSAHNPLTCTVFDGNDADDRRPLIGSWDGYVRFIDPEATDDDGYVILSEVILGPLLTKDMDDLLAKTIQGVLASTSGDVDYAVYVGATAEVALASAPVVTGTWTQTGGNGRNFTNLIRRSGHAIYVGLSAQAPWAIEGVRIGIAGTGRVRRRGV